MTVYWLQWAVTREREFSAAASGQSLSEAGAKDDALKAIRNPPPTKCNNWNADTLRS